MIKLKVAQLEIGKLYWAKGVTNNIDELMSVTGVREVDGIKKLDGYMVYNFATEGPNRAPNEKWCLDFTEIDSYFYMFDIGCSLKKYKRKHPEEFI